VPPPSHDAAAPAVCCRVVAVAGAQGVQLLHQTILHSPRGGGGNCLRKGGAGLLGRKGGASNASISPS
jgi:hypothetical protein